MRFLSSATLKKSGTAFDEASNTTSGGGRAPQNRGFIHNVTVKISLCSLGVCGLFVAAIFIAKAICIPQFWIRYKTFWSLIPCHEPLPQDDLQIAKWMALEIAKRILLRVRQLPAIGGHFLCHLKTKTNCSIFGLPSHWAYPRQPKCEHSCQKSDAKNEVSSTVKNK